MEDLNKKEPEIKKPWWQDSVMLFTQLSGWIGIPVILGVFLGKWLDDRYNTKPWLFLITVGVAFIISMVGIVREATSAISREAGSVSSGKKIDNTKDNHNGNSK